MKNFFLVIIQLVFILFPWALRKPILNLLPGFSIHSSAKIGLSIILADQVIMEEGSLITHFSFINNINKLLMKSYSKIGKSNWITGANTRATMFRDSERNCELIVGKHTRITGQHHIDCTGGVYIGDFTTVAGVRSQILSHSVDIKESKQVADAVKIGDYCFIGTSSIILMGSVLPNCCVLGAGSILNKKYDEPYYLYAGNPAREVKKLDKMKYKYFEREHGHIS